MQPDYNLIRQLLSDPVPDLNPAMLHGAISGWLGSGAAPDLDVFSDLFETELPAVVLRLIERLGNQALEELQQQDYSFHLLLPQDDSSLAGRLEALSQWCDCFNVGFSAGYMTPQTPLSVDVMEILNDFGQLAEVEAPAGGDEEDEQYYMELVEFVRMAAITVYQQMQDALATAAADDNTDTPNGQGHDPDDDQLLH